MHFVNLCTHYTQKQYSKNKHFINMIKIERGNKMTFTSFILFFAIEFLVTVVNAIKVFYIQGMKITTGKVRQRLGYLKNIRFMFREVPYKPKSTSS